MATPSRIYDGWPYAAICGRQLAQLRGRVAGEVAAGARVLDAGSGTGELALELAPRCAEVLGVERSPRMHAYAERVRSRRGIGNVRFRLGDAGHLPDLPDGSFDVATSVMVVHELPEALRERFLRELARVAREVLLTDFAAPMPLSAAGLRNRLFELLAGPAHFAAFRSFQRRGGLPALLERAGLERVSQRALDRGALVMVRCREAQGRERGRRARVREEPGTGGRRG